MHPLIGWLKYKFNCLLCRLVTNPSMALNGPIKCVFLCLIICLYYANASQARKKHGWRQSYPFIKTASSVSSSSFNRADRSYDYIVVGGGTAGCPLAATLSRNFRVLILERGGVPFGNSNVSDLKKFHISLADTSKKSASQFFVSTDGVINSRARVLGGGTCINAGFYTRASQRYIKKASWDIALVNESYSWIEKQIVFKPKLAPWQNALKNGLLEIGVSPDNGYTFDHKFGTKVGGTIFNQFDRRHTSADLLGSANPQNLTVLIHATVQQIVFHTAGKRPKAVGVVFKDENGKYNEAFLSRRRGSEIIVSCGAIGSPQLLLLSGIGPSADLKRLNISVVFDNKFVGKGMTDNPHNSIFVPTQSPVQQSLIQAVGITKMGVYIEASSGFGQSSDSIRCNHGIMSAEIGQLSTIPPNKRTSQAIQSYIRSKKDLPREAFMGGFILEKIALPLSRGELHLLNKNIDENPSVTFNYFSHPRDLRRCVEGIRMVEKVVKSNHFTNFTKSDSPTMHRLLNMSVRANVNLIPKHTNDTKSLQQFCRDTVITIWHYHGGCKVGKVVDSEYNVLGVDRIRVIDGSTFSESPGTNPQATVLMLGRYMGVRILRKRLREEAVV